MAVTAVKIPVIGEKFHEGGFRMAKMSLQGTDADTAGTFHLFEIKAGANVFIREILTQVEVALPSGITTSIGDSDNVDAWMTVEQVADTVAATNWVSSLVVDSAKNEYFCGRYFGDTASAYVDAVITGALAGTGKINVIAVYSTFSEF